jgi:hypothetical protein
MTRFRNWVLCALAPLAVLLAPVGHARGIVVDETTICAALANSNSAGAIELSASYNGTSYGPVLGTATTGIGSGFAVWACPDSMAPDANITFLNFNPNANVMYTWLTPPNVSYAGVQTSALAVSNFGAQVAVLQITTPAYNGDYEVEFNYADYVLPGGSASGSCAESSAALSWFGKSYVFNGAAGATLCGTNSSNDFLFSRDGALLGYFNAPANGAEPTLVNSLPPG